jgi:hypothetical protein
MSIVVQRISRIPATFMAIILAIGWFFLSPPSRASLPLQSQQPQNGSKPDPELCRIHLKEMRGDHADADDHRNDYYREGCVSIMGEPPPKNQKAKAKPDAELCRIHLREMKGDLPDADDHRNDYYTEGCVSIMGVPPPKNQKAKTKPDPELCRLWLKDMQTDSPMAGDHRNNYERAHCESVTGPALPHR